MDLMTVALFVAGGVLLVGGAELLVRGASRLALAAGISPLVIGLTVVAMGTSAPELSVTVGASLGGNTDVALGNVVGSNICNILLILGLSAAITRLEVSKQLVRLDVPVVIAASVLVWLLALDGRIGRGDGLLLFGILVVYTVYLIRKSRRQTDPDEADGTEPETVEADGNSSRPWWVDVGLLVVGLGLLVVGSGWLVDAAVTTATAFGISELVIGLTIVAIGTSLPELATSVLAALRGQRDIAVGNAVGSNLFNLLAVLGLGSIVAPAGLPVSAEALTFDLPVMIGVAIAALPVFFTGYAIARWEGLMFLAFYAAYLAYLVLGATDSPVLPGYRDALVFFVLPLTALTLGGFTVRSLQRHRA